MLGSRKCNIIHTRLRHQCSPLGADLFRANIINDSSCPYGCPLEDDIHYLLECPLYTNARMQLYMNIIPYTVTLLFGSYNLTDETNLIVFTIALNPVSSFFPPPFLFIKYIYVCIYYICNLLSFSYSCV
jgi:hypothetical protein